MNDANLPRASGTHAYYALGVLTVTYVFNFLDRQLLAILVEPIKAEFNATDTQMGLLYGLAFSLFYATLAIPVARLADTGVRKNILAIAAGLWSLMTVLCGFAQNFTQLLLLRIGVAVGEAGGVPPSQSMIADYFPPESRARAMAVFSTGTFIGTLIAMIGGAWIAQNLGWRQAFIIVGAPGILLALLIKLTIREPERGAFDVQKSEQFEPGGFTKFIADVGRLSSLRWIIAGCAMAGIAGYGIGYWAPAFMMRVHDKTLVEAGIMIGGLGATMGLIGSLFGGWLCDVLSRRDAKWLVLIPAVSLFVSLPLMAAFLLWPDSNIAIGWYCLAGFFGSWWAAPTYVIVQALVEPRQRTLACAALLFVMNLIGFGLGPLLVGVLSDFFLPAHGNFSVRYALLIVLSSYIFAIVCYVMASRDYSAQRYEQRLLARET